MMRHLFAVMTLVITLGPVTANANATATATANANANANAWASPSAPAPDQTPTPNQSPSPDQKALRHALEKYLAKQGHEIGRAHV